MDPATARVVLKLQLDDVDAILKTLAKTNNNGVVNSERVAFAALRGELLKKWHSIHGQIYAHRVIREQNAGQEAFKRLLSEEQQAERDHDMACRLAGKPVLQRPAVPPTPTTHETAAEQKSEAINGNTLTDKNLRFDLTGMQTAPSNTEFLPGKKRPAEDDLSSTLKSRFKRARVEDVDDEDGNSITSHAHTSTPKKRRAHIDPATLREDEDGRTKRAEFDRPADEPLLHCHDQSVKAAILSATCSSCLDMHATRNILQLPCKDDGDVDAHAYCRECLTRLFECSITDPSHFPPRCCSKIIPIISCIPFLPPAVFSRFVAKREELEMLDRTYCSNSKCSNWVRPANIVAGTATCAECYQNTCVTCKSKQHDGLCLEDRDVKKLMSVAKAKRWQTCPKCKEMVELERGCYHITCRCQYEFCYTCLAKWRTCKCPLWDERRIVDRPIPANGVARNAANNLPPVIRANPPAPFGFPPPIEPVAQPQPQVQPRAVNNQQGNGRRRNRRNRMGNNQAHVHEFERYYRSEGDDTKCDLCGLEDRWANGCQSCDLMICRICTKHRL